MSSITSQLTGQSKKRPLSSYIWDTWDKSPEERRFLTKLDTCLLSYASLSYFSKYLDQQNVTNAYVSGMQDDLKLHGNQLNYITTAWTCGYVLGQIPSNMLITRIRPSLWIPAMEVIWSILTMTLASSKSFTSLVIIRFFVGLAESSFYPAIQYVIGSWYKGDELGKRACIFHTTSAIGPMFSGFLQTGAYNGLNGRYGLAGWQWLFIIDAQLAMARKRMEEIGRRPPTKYTKKKIIGFFKTWHIWTLVPLYILFNNGGNPASSMIFWLKSFNTPGHTVYTIAQINLYPLGINAVQVVTTLIWAWWSDAVWSMVNCIVLASSPLYTHITRRWVFYYFTSCTGGLSGLILAWANELTGYDNEKRSFVVACCNTFAYVFQAWLPIVLFPQVEQPRVQKGTIATIFINFGMICFALLTMVLQKRDERRNRKYLDDDEVPEGTIILETEEPDDASTDSKLKD
ncbi:MFS general substrate transporter [Neolentinus lepideus HHB14362 ss-1]|uniref:MFS general substrate transporter n=1 Tax=Neolentinus lepideus HHB14362 ss-1 TaxID=1314782 RepID=A0A165NML7_9AGAM|nr:MFS general substrate transporter [Neolentinus lepideus HHB14362 ss-1]